VTFDYEGIGGSVPDTPQDPIAKLKTMKTTSIKTWAQNTKQLILEYKQRYPGRPVVLIGHSVGGHILGFLENLVDRALFVAVNSAYHGTSRKSGTYLFYPFALYSKFFYGYFDSPFLGLGENLPSHAGLQWAYWSRFPDYMRHNKKTADEFDLVKTPLRSIFYRDDEMAGQRAFEWAAFSMLPNAPSKLYRMDCSGGHFGFFRKDSIHLWKATLGWILSGHEIQLIESMQEIPCKSSKL
jgi:predicted alpha/beta hydrolase